MNGDVTVEVEVRFIRECEQYRVVIGKGVVKGILPTKHDASQAALLALAEAIKNQKEKELVIIRARRLGWTTRRNGHEIALHT